jgi:hypothetical protein
LLQNVASARFKRPGIGHVASPHQKNKKKKGQIIITKLTTWYCIFGHFFLAHYFHFRLPILLGEIYLTFNLTTMQIDLRNEQRKKVKSQISGQHRSELSN